MKVKKVPARKLKAIVSECTQNNADHAIDIDIAEMAIPSYLHWNPFIRRLMWKRYIFISRLANFTKDMSVLEFGCGAGIFLPELASKCNKVYAIERFPVFVKLLNWQQELNVLIVDSIDEIEDASLDIIVAADVLEHLLHEELLDLIKVFLKKLKPGGRLLISGPTENFVYKIGRILAGAKNAEYHHTNIDALCEVIGKTFLKQRIRTLPYVTPPYLFKICEFRKM